MTSDRRRRRQRSAGPAPDTPVDDVLLTIGRIVSPHGIRGEVKMVLVTDRPERLADLRRVYLDGASTPTRLVRSRLHGSGREALLKFAGVDDRDAAERLRGAIVQIRANQLPPPDEGSYFHYQILGLRAYDESDALLGEVTEIIEAGEIDVYVVTGDDGRQQLFPALRNVVLDIDPGRGRMLIRPQQWTEEDAG